MHGGRPMNRTGEVGTGRMEVLTKETVSKPIAPTLATGTGLAARRNGHEGRLDRAYRLKPDESPPAGMRRIATGRIEKAVERLAEAQEAEDPTSGVHGVRKDLKKLRSELRLLRHELGDDLYRAENGTYREAGRLLSESRDAEVKVETLADICERCEGTLPPGAAEEWIDALREERDLAVASTRDGAGSTALGKATELIEAGRARVVSWPLERESWKLVGPGIERAYRRGRKRMRRTAAEPSPANVHEWRKRVKDLWYQLRILEVATPKKLRDRVEVADRLARRARRPPRPRSPPRRSPPPRAADGEQGAAGRGNRAAPAGARGGGV